MDGVADGGSALCGLGSAGWAWWKRRRTTMRLFVRNVAQYSKEMSWKEGLWYLGIERGTEGEAKVIHRAKEVKNV